MVQRSSPQRTDAAVTVSVNLTEALLQVKQVSYSDNPLPSFDQVL